MRLAHGHRHRRAIAIAVVVLGIGGAAFAATTLAGPGSIPGDVTGLVSPTHPDQATWYRSTTPSFSWNPSTAAGSAIAGYSIVLDQSPDTAPDTTSDRVSLDFLPRVTNTTGSGPTEVRVGDLNGDGRKDLVIEDNGANTVSVLLGRGDGTFAPRVTYPTGNGPWSLRLGDVNNDGKLDIVTANRTASTVSVLLGRGDGTFAAKTDFTTGTNPESLALGDVNNDGKLDIMTTNSGANTVSVLRGNGDGTFAKKVDFGTGGKPTSIDLGDLNGDGKIDLVCANAGTANVSVLTGKGDGTFNTKVDSATGSQPYTVIVADVNKDGKPDIETVNYGANTASVLLNKGDGTFDQKVDYPVGAGPYALAVADLNQDGAPDLVTTNHDANTVSILFGNGDGTFVAKTDRATGTGPFWVALGDFNGDGYGDLAVTDQTANTASIFVGTNYLAASYSGKADGIWYFHVRALDSLGAGGAVATRQIRIDTTAPATVQSGADAGWHNAPVIVNFTATDAASGVASTEYKVDGGDWTTGAAVTVPDPASGSNDGPHVVSYRSTDVAGNVETTRTCAVNIVTSAPTTSVSGADAAWHAGDVSLNFASASFGVTDTQYSLDGGATWTSGTSAVIPAPVDGSNDGVHTVLYRSVNGAGLTETPRSCTVKIDTGAPTTSVSGADDAWHDSDVTLHFSGSDAGSGVNSTEYSLDGGATWTSGTSAVIPAPVDGSNDGSHTVLYRSTDALGHLESPARSCTVKIDTGAPTTSVSGADDAWHDSDVTLHFSGSDAGSGVSSTEYSLDGGATWTSGTSAVIPAPVDGSNDGAHTVLYRSIDAAGNIETPAESCTVKIDVGIPVTSDNAGGVWHSVPFTLQLTPTDGQLDVTKTEFKIGDDGIWQTGDATTFTKSWKRGGGSGPVTVYYRSTDAAGHIESIKSCQVMLDTSRPVTRDDAPKNPCSTDVTVHFAATDAFSGIAATWYTIDGGPWQSGSTASVPAPAGHANDGLHTIIYYSIDNAGNVESGYRVCKVVIATP